MRKTLLTALPLVLLGLASAANAPQKLSINMYEMGFKASGAVLQAGVPAEITIVNSGKAEHELQAYLTPSAAPTNWDSYISANKLWKGAKVSLEVDGKPVQGNFMEVGLKPGQKAVLRFTPAVKGSFELGCHIPGHYEAGMKNALTVQ